VLKQRAPSFAMDYSCPTASGTSTFYMAVTPINYGDARVAIAHTEVKDIYATEVKNFRLLQQFARRSINAQEQERQRISREIHDALSNRMAGMAWSVRQIIKKGGEDPISFELKRVIAQIGVFSAAMRALPHGFPPPLLRHVGIKAALKSLRDSFEKTH